MTLAPQTAVAGGGRYDGLAKQLGGDDVPGVGCLRHGKAGAFDE